MTVLVEFLDFRVGIGIGDQIKPKIVRELYNYRIILKMLNYPLIKRDQEEIDRDNRGAAEWISLAALDFVRGTRSVKDLRDEGYEFKLYTPEGKLIADTLARPRSR